MDDILLANHRSQRGPGLRLKRLIWSAAGGIALGGLYAGRIAPGWIRFSRLDMPLPNLPNAFEGSTLVHLSDLHCSPIVREGYLRRFIDHVNDLQPDFVVITGDFVTGGTAYAQRIARILSKCTAKVARLGCLGNHDYGVLHPRGHGHMRQLAGYISRRLFEAGVHILRNEHAIFRRDGQSIQFVGVDDLWSGLYDPQAAFDGCCRGLPTVGLTHNPDTAGQLIHMGANWVLSGHTHGSGLGRNPLSAQFFPQEHRHLVAGHYRFENGDLYVNRGMSYGRRGNLLNKRPEITVFTLRNA